MSTLEFQAKVENGIIVVPEKYKQELAEASTVKIVVLKQPKKQTMQFDIMDELAQKPVLVPGIRSITREEMHERYLSQKKLVCLILAFIPITKLERIEKCLPLLHLVGGHLHPHDNSSVV